jgi:hypothetical protein
VDNDLINPTTTHENELEYVNHLLTETPSGYRDKNGFTMGYHDTPGHFDSRVNIHDSGAGHVNKGARKRWVAFSQSANIECLDHLDLLGHNKRYVPSSYEMKVAYFIVWRKPKCFLVHELIVRVPSC